MSRANRDQCGLQSPQQRVDHGRTGVIDDFQHTLAVGDVIGSLIVATFFGLSRGLDERTGDNGRSDVRL